MPFIHAEKSGKKWIWVREKEKKKTNKSSVYNRLNLRCPLNTHVEMATGSRTQMSEAHG